MAAGRSSTRGSPLPGAAAGRPGLRRAVWPPRPGLRRGRPRREDLTPSGGGVWGGGFPPPVWALGGGPRVCLMLPAGFLCQGSWTPLPDCRGKERERNLPRTTLDRQHLEARHDAMYQLRFQPEPHIFVHIQVFVAISTPSYSPEKIGASMMITARASATKTRTMFRLVESQPST